MNRLKRWLIFIAAGVILLDRLVKQWVLATLELGEVRTFLPGLRLTYFQNTGMAFSFLQNHQWILIALIPVVMIVLWICLARNMFPCPVQQIGIVCVMAGGLSNWVDRILYRFVVDMFEFTFVRFAVFNVADIFITSGAILFLIAYVFHEHKNGKSAKQEGSNAAE